MDLFLERKKRLIRTFLHNAYPRVYIAKKGQTGEMLICVFIAKITLRI